MQLRHAVLAAVLLGSVISAAAAAKSAARQLTSTVGGRNDPEVSVLYRFSANAACLTVRHRRRHARTWHLHVCAGARTTVMTHLHPCESGRAALCLLASGDTDPGRYVTDTARIL